MRSEWDQNFGKLFKGPRKKSQIIIAREGGVKFKSAKERLNPGYKSPNEKTLRKRMEAARKRAVLRFDD